MSATLAKKMISKEAADIAERPRAAQPPLRKSKPRNADWASGDAAKFFSYTEAWARIKLSSKQGFFLEAVTIEESIVSDRLLSFLEKTCGLVLKDGTKGNLNQLIDRWLKEAAKRAAADDEALALFSALHSRLNAWREQRNHVVHGMVKSSAARGDDHIESFLARAKTVAADGEKIAREISRWVDKQKKSAPRSSPTVPSKLPATSLSGEPDATHD